MTAVEPVGISKVEKNIVEDGNFPAIRHNCPHGNASMDPLEHATDGRGLVCEAFSYRPRASRHAHTTGIQRAEDLGFRRQEDR